MTTQVLLPPSAVTTQVLSPPSALTTTIHYSVIFGTQSPHLLLLRVSPGEKVICPFREKSVRVVVSFGLSAFLCGNPVLVEGDVPGSSWTPVHTHTTDNKNK